MKIHVYKIYLKEISATIVGLAISLESIYHGRRQKYNCSFCFSSFNYCVKGGGSVMLLTKLGSDLSCVTDMLAADSLVVWR